MLRPALPRLRQRLRRRRTRLQLLPAQRPLPLRLRPDGAAAAAQGRRSPAGDIEAVFISHFHADHFFGLPFLFLDAKYGGRTKDLTIVGPPGIEAATHGLLELGYPGVANSPGYTRRYVEADDGCSNEAAGLNFTASLVKHVDEFECFAYRVEIGGRSLVYSGDTTLCEGLLRLVRGADVIVTECSCTDVPVHLGPKDVEVVAKQAPGAPGHRHAPRRPPAPRRLRRPARRRRPQALPVLRLARFGTPVA